MAKKYPEISRCKFEDVEIVNPRWLGDPEWHPEQQVGHRSVNLNFTGIGLMGRVSLRKLEKILYLADREFEIVAEYTGTTVVPHQWILLGNSSTFGLAAQVERIAIDDDADLNAGAEQGIERYNRRRRWLPWGLADVACRQFVNGSTASISDSTTIFCDIDPLFKMPPSLC